MADSVAHGWDTTAAVTRWHLHYLSKDAVDARRDVNGGRYQDGGDLSCEVRPDASCVSAPELCLGDGPSSHCMGFRFHGDSLALSNGAKYKRRVTD